MIFRRSLLSLSFALVASTVSSSALADDVAARIASVYVNADGVLEVGLMNADGAKLTDLCSTLSGAQAVARTQLREGNRDLLTMATSAFLSGQPVVLRTQVRTDCVLEGIQLVRE